MAIRATALTVTAPAMTDPLVPVEADLGGDGSYVVERVEIVVPSGHAGLTGIALALAHSPLIPANPGGYIIADDEVIRWDLDAVPFTQWTAFAYNEDVFDHSWHLRFLLGLPKAGAEAVPPIVEPIDVEPGEPPELPEDEEPLEAPELPEDEEPLEAPEEGELVSGPGEHTEASQLAAAGGSVVLGEKGAEERLPTVLSSQKGAAGL